MPRFEIIYSADPTGRGLHSESIVARDRSEAGARALAGLQGAHARHGAVCYRVLDGLGMVVTRGPKSPAPPDVS